MEGDKTHLSWIWLLVGFAVGAPAPSAVSAQDESTSIALQVIDDKGSRIDAAEVLFFDGIRGKRLTVGPDGDWSLNGATGIVVAHHEGYQYSGDVIDGDTTNPLQLVLQREDQPSRPRKTLPLPLDESARIELKDHLIDRLWGSLETTRDMQTRGRLLAILGAFDSAKTDRYMVDNSDLTATEMINAQREIVAVLAATDPLRAVELAADVDQPMFQSMILHSLVKHLPSKSPLRSRCEDQWLQVVESVVEPQLRFAVLAAIAEHFEKSDRPAEAEKLIGANVDEVERLPSGGWSAYPRGLFAALIVNDDPLRAERMVADTLAPNESEKRELRRSWARLAFACSPSQPELAAKFLQLAIAVDESGSPFNHQFRVIQWMAAERPEAAIELARNLNEPLQRAWTLGIVARRIHAGNRKLAQTILMEAAATCVTAVAAPQPPSGTTMQPATILAGLLPVAEQVAPEQVESMIWQSVWCAIPRSRFATGGVSNDQMIQNTAAAIARYDREIGLALNSSRTISPTGSWDAGVKLCLVLTPEDFTAFLQKAEEEARFHRFNPHEVALQMVTSCELEFWDMVSLPGFLSWQSDSFEDQ